MALQFEKIKPHIGANVHVKHEDLRDDAVIDQIAALLDDRGVLVFPKFGLSDADQLAFTDKLGGRVNYFKGISNEEQDVFKLTLDPEVNRQPDTVYVTYFWHMDGTTQEAPPKSTVLSARRVAPKGGQTEFASTFAGYESLSDDEKDEIEGLRAVHTIYSYMRGVTDAPTDEQRDRWGRYTIDKDHPIVWKQKSGRKSLVIGSSADHVVDMPTPNGRALLARLLDWTVQPEFRYRHHWQEGDMLMWNNYGVLHRAIPYDPSSGRMMHRTTVVGVEPIT